MEHRWSVRTPLTIQVTIYQNKLPMAVCTAKDIGLGGLFISTTPLLKYPKHSTLDVEFELYGDGKLNRYRMPACVVHEADDGFGLMFLDSDAEVKQTIRKFILENTPRPVRGASHGISLAAAKNAKLL